MSDEKTARPEVDLDAAARAIDAFLRAIGAPIDSDPELRETPRRVAEAFAHELLAGYGMAPAVILADATTSSSPGMVVLDGVTTTLMCPHHLLPAPGTVRVGYVPRTKIVGIGALASLVECFGRRLTLQEDFCQNVANALVTHLDARGAGCIAELSPSCVTARGPTQHRARMITVAWAGEAIDDPSMRDQLVHAAIGRRTTLDE